VSPSCHASSIDIVDYYLGAILPYPESVRIDLPFPSPPSQNLVSFHSSVIPDVLKTVPGFPQSGFLSQLRLVFLLTQQGFSETTTPMLFRHRTHSTAFTLVVDDFLIRYSHPSELDHLVSCLSTLYELKVHRDLPRYTYLGLYYRLLPHLTVPPPSLPQSLPPKRHGSNTYISYTPHIPFNIDLNTYPFRCRSWVTRQSPTYFTTHHLRTEAKGVLLVSTAARISRWCKGVRGQLGRASVYAPS
jgi:hypothetical protein